MKSRPYPPRAFEHVGKNIVREWSDFHRLTVEGVYGDDLAERIRKEVVSHRISVRNHERKLRKSANT